ncbi:YegP family protein [Arthrobacter sp. R4-81]
MSGYFELVDAPDGGYRIRMLDGTGALMAVSITFPTKKAAVAGIAKAREIAGTGLVRDRSHDQQSAPVKQQSLKQHVKAARKSTAVGGHGQLIAAGRRAGMGH